MARSWPPLAAVMNHVPGGGWKLEGTRLVVTNALAGMVSRMALVAALVVVSAGCGDEGAATGPASSSSGPAAPSASTATPSSTLLLQLSRPEEDAKIPNPGSGGADPRLTAALLTRFQAGESVAPTAVPEIPGATVRFPVRDGGSMFFGLRQAGSIFTGASSCMKWTSGMWMVLVSDFATTPEVQLAISMLRSPLPPPPPGVDALTPQGRAALQRRGSLVFSEAIITGPPQVMGMLADEHIPGECSRLTDDKGAAGRIELLPAAPVGDHSWAYRIIDATGEARHWTQVVRFRDHLIEIRIPSQEPRPRGDMVSILHQIATQAHAKAAKTLT